MKQFLNGIAREKQVPVLATLKRLMAIKQQSLADWLQRHSEHFSFAAKRNALLLFCLFFSSASIAVLMHSFSNSVEALSVQTMRLPKQPQVDNIAVPDSVLPMKVYNRIQRFSWSIAVMQNDPLRKFYADSLLKARPFLRDSLRKIDSIFYSQP